MLTQGLRPGLSSAAPAGLEFFLALASIAQDAPRTRTLKPSTPGSQYRASRGPRRGATQNRRGPALFGSVYSRTFSKLLCLERYLAAALAAAGTVILAESGCDQVSFPLVRTSRFMVTVDTLRSTSTIR